MGESMADGIRARRLALGIKQSKLAADAGMTVGELSRLERGFVHPSASQYSVLARSLATTPATLRKGQKEYLARAIPGEGYTTVPVFETVVHARQAEPPENRWKVLDLFCGCGGLSYGFEESGHFAVTAGIDLLPDRIETFKTNHPHAVSIVGDIRDFPAERLSELALQPDVVIGGPPCQGFSSIRPYRTLTEGDPRNSLPEEFVVLVGAIRPKWFIFENVVGLLTHGGGEAFAALLHGFGDAGYSVDWRVINMALLGLPQARERLIVVGSADGQPFPWPTVTHAHEHRSMAGRGAKRLHVEPLFASALTPAVTVMDAIGDLPPIPAGGSADCYRDDVEPSAYVAQLRRGASRLTLHESTDHSEKMLAIIRQAGTNRSALPPGMTTSGFSSCYSRLEADKPSVTLTVNFVHPASNRCIHPYQDRALTPREGARLQSFPDDFQFKGTRAQVVKQIGNAVPPLLGRALAERLVRVLGQKVPERSLLSEGLHTGRVSVGQPDTKVEHNRRRVSA